MDHDCKAENEVRLPPSSTSSIPSRIAQLTKSDAWLSAACAAVVLLGILATWPFFEMGFNDDWHYVYIALQVAKTGLLTYTGCSTMVGIQAFWAALWIKCFGFSFTLVRASTLPFVVGCSVLLYYLLLAARLRRRFAVFGTVTFMLSPLMVPLEASFLTDLPGLFFLLLCLLSYQRLIDADARSKYLIWSTVLFMSGLAGGTIRQIIWIVPFLMFPLLARERQRRTGLLWILWITGFICAAALAYWFHFQPYVATLPGLNPLAVSALRSRLWPIVPALVFLNVTTLTIEVMALMFPLLVLGLPLKNTRLPRNLLVFAWVSFGLVVVLSAMLSQLRPMQLFTGNVLSKWGLLPADIPGPKPVVLPYFVQLIIGLCAAWLSMILGVTFFRKLSGARSLVRSIPSSFIGPYILFSILYLGALTPLSLTWNVFDRYMVPVLPLITILVLKTVQNAGIRDLSIAATVSMCVMITFGVFTTHDYFARSRARLDAVTRVMAAGTSRDQISGGFEFDGWTELLAAGHANDPGITNPPGSYISMTNRTYPTPDPFWFWPYAPSVNPEFVLSLSPVRGLRDSAFAPVSYRTWMPPFSGSILIQQADHSSHTVSAHPSR